MKVWKVVYRIEALVDIENFVVYCERSDASQKFTNVMMDQIASLQRNPYRFRSVSNRSGYRRMLFRPFQVFYEIDETTQTVRVMRVWHSARDLWE